VTFGPKTNTAELQQRTEKSRSNLIKFFDYNHNHTNGRHLLYHEFPTHYVYNKKEKTWTPRKKDKAVGRVYYINPGAGECFFLRILLIAVPNPIFYEYLRTVNGVLYGIFKEVCLARELIADDNEWI